MGQVMKSRFMGFIGPSYEGRSKNIDDQRCVNLYPEVNEMNTGPDGEKFSLVSVPGKNSLVMLPKSIQRGSWVANEVLYVVYGNTLYSVANNFTYISLGTLATSSGPVSMADDGFNLVLVDGVRGYDYNLTSGQFVDIATSINPNFPGADVVVVQDTYFIFNVPGTNQFFFSGITANPNATALIFFNSPIDVGSKEGASDIISSLCTAHQNLWIFGKETIEVWYDAANPIGVPFSQISGVFIQQGCAAAFSVVKIDNTIFWLGRNKEGQGIVYSANGYIPQRISTNAVEISIQSETDLSGATAYAYQENGHNFYALNVPGLSKTWVFDTLTHFWHERAYLNNGVLERDRGAFYSFAYGKKIVGDYQTGNLYELTDAVYSDNGNPLARIRRAPHIVNKKNRIFCHSFQLDIESGVGIDGTGQGVDPQAMLKFSNDGGHTWSDEFWASMGAIGRTFRQVVWRRLGQARDRIYEITITDPVKVIIVGAVMELEMGSS